MQNHHGFILVGLYSAVLFMLKNMTGLNRITSFIVWQHDYCLPIVVSDVEFVLCKIYNLTTYQ